MKKKSNSRRTLDAIAGDIHKSERANIFQIGKLLIEAKDRCEHGHWLDWLKDEFEWTPATADNYMSVARLAAKYKTVLNLQVPARTLYAVAHLVDEAVPDALTRLGAAAKKGRVSADQGQKIVDLAALRCEHGKGLPEATLLALTDHDLTDEMIATLKAQKPKTEAAVKELRQVISEIIHEQAEADAEAAQILDGPPPELPPSTDTEEPMRLGTITPDIEVKDVSEAVRTLFRISTHSVVAKLADAVADEQLRSVLEFLTAVVEHNKKDAA